MIPCRVVPWVLDHSPEIGFDSASVGAEITLSDSRDRPHIDPTSCGNWGDSYHNVILEPEPARRIRRLDPQQLRTRVHNPPTHVFSHLESSVTLLREQRQALITAAVTGQIDVREEVAV